jgi:hypothetical protein
LEINITSGCHVDIILFDNLLVNNNIESPPLKKIGIVQRAELKREFMAHSIKMKEVQTALLNADKNSNSTTPKKLVKSGSMKEFPARKKGEDLGEDTKKAVESAVKSLIGSGAVLKIPNQSLTKGRLSVNLNDQGKPSSTEQPTPNQSTQPVAQPNTVQQPATQSNTVSSTPSVQPAQTPSTTIQAPPSSQPAQTPSVTVQPPATQSTTTSSSQPAQTPLVIVQQPVTQSTTVQSALSAQLAQTPAATVKQPVTPTTPAKTTTEPMSIPGSKSPIMGTRESLTPNSNPRYSLSQSLPDIKSFPSPKETTLSTTPRGSNIKELAKLFGGGQPPGM